MHCTSNLVCSYVTGGEKQTEHTAHCLHQESVKREGWKIKIKMVQRGRESVDQNTTSIMRTHKHLGEMLKAVCCICELQECMLNMNFTKVRQ